MATRDDRAPAGYGATPAPRPSASAPSRGLRLAALASFATFVAALGVAGVAGRDPFLGGILAGSLGSSPQGSPSRGVTPPACLGGGDSTSSLKPGVGLPVVVVGMPKAGTTSLAAYFRCGGLDVSHYECGDHAKCGACIERAFEHRARDVLDACGSYAAWAQMDFEGAPNTKGAEGLDGAKDRCFFPQVEALEAIASAHPSATFVLNRREDYADWVRSVDDWGDMRARLRDCDITGLPAGAGGEGDDETLIAFAEAHADRVRRLFGNDRSESESIDGRRHALVEVVIDREDAGEVLEAAFGIDARRCWGQENEGRHEGDDGDPSEGGAASGSDLGGAGEQRRGRRGRRFGRGREGREDARSSGGCARGGLGRAGGGPGGEGRGEGRGEVRGEVRVFGA
jgi:hypothetical protein